MLEICLRCTYLMQIHQCYTCYIPVTYLIPKILDIYLIYKSEYEIYLRYTTDICDLFQRNAWNISEIYMRYTRDILEIYKKYTRDIPEIYQIYTRDIPEILLRCTRNIPEIYQIYTKEIPWISYPFRNL